jgi:hypothetical protein
MDPDSPSVRRINDPNNTSGTAAYMVAIPLDVRGGQQFPVSIQGQQLMVTCPQNVTPGMSVRVVHPPPPTDLTRAPSGPISHFNETAQIKLKYDKDDWSRTLRSDMRFQWVRFDDKV